jgi:hypothetical protein
MRLAARSATHAFNQASLHALHASSSPDRALSRPPCTYLSHMLRDPASPPLLFLLTQSPPASQIHEGFISIALSVKVVEGVVIQVGGQGQGGELVRQDEGSEVVEGRRRSTSGVGDAGLCEEQS